MIKIFKNKFLICIFLLVVSVFITSSCYAFSNTIEEAPFTLNDFYESSAFQNKLGSVDISNIHVFTAYNSNSSNYSIYVFNDSNISYFKSYTEGNAPSIRPFNSSDTLITSSSLYFFEYTTAGGFAFQTGYGGQPWSTTYLCKNYTFTNQGWSHFTNCNTDNLYKADGTLWCEALGVVNLSFTYKFEGIKRGQVKLTINGLDSSLKMYGYVGLETYPDGDTLNPSFSIDNLRLLATKTDNSDLYCYLYDGEELFYYIVDENNKILDVGSITDMAKGDFLYGFNVSNGVDFVFLRDGVPYWDNSLTFKYNTNNSNTIQNNDIVSTGNYSYIETSKTVASGTYTGYVFDSSGNLVVQADCDYGNNLSSLSIEVDTSYYETHTILKHISCYWLQSITLTGTNSDGSFIDFSNYKVQWSVPTWVTFESIELGFEEYNMRSGTLTGFTSAGSLSMFNLQLYENLSDHTRNFDITLQVYDGNGNLVLTHIVNSDNIVADQIKSEENNVDKGDYDIVDNPGYTGGSDSNYGDIGNIQNWTADDYINLMSTDNFVWEFFKAILGNLPWWITTPLTILIFGVVIITIIRFARGA